MAQSLLERRRIEAQFAKAIFDVLAEETGRERAAEILAKAVIRLATEAGAAFAGQRSVAGGFHPQPLTEPCLTFSCHTALQEVRFIPVPPKCSHLVDQST